MRSNYAARGITFCIVLICGFHGASASADPFVIIADNQNSLVGLDIGDIQRPNGKPAKIWQIIRYLEPPQTNGGMVKFRNTQYEVRCESNEVRRSYEFLIAEDGDRIAYFPISEEWVPIPPGSHLKDMRRIACEGANENDPEVANLTDFEILHDTTAQKSRN